jgi:hypothetical protein
MLGSADDGIVHLSKKALNIFWIKCWMFEIHRRYNYDLDAQSWLET